VRGDGGEIKIFGSDNLTLNNSASFEVISVTNKFDISL
jgi:hypothetical protein